MKKLNKKIIGIFTALSLIAACSFSTSALKGRHRTKDSTKTSTKRDIRSDRKNKGLTVLKKDGETKVSRREMDKRGQKSDLVELDYTFKKQQGLERDLYLNAVLRKLLEKHGLLANLMRDYKCAMQTPCSRDHELGGTYLFTFSENSRKKSNEKFINIFKELFKSSKDNAVGVEEMGIELTSEDVENQKKLCLSSLKELRDMWKKDLYCIENLVGKDLKNLNSIDDAEAILEDIGKEKSNSIILKFLRDNEENLKKTLMATAKKNDKDKDFKKSVERDINNYEIKIKDFETRKEATDAEKKDFAKMMFDNSDMLNVIEANIKDVEKLKAEDVLAVEKEDKLLIQDVDYYHAIPAK